MKTGIVWRLVNGQWRVTILIRDRVHMNTFQTGGNARWTQHFMEYLRQWKLPEAS